MSQRNYYTRSYDPREPSTTGRSMARNGLSSRKTKSVPAEYHPEKKGRTSKEKKIL